MAIKKTISNENGIVTDYHKISHIMVGRQSEENKNDYIIVARLDSYISADIRNKGANLIAQRCDVSLNATKEAIESKPILALAYDKLKAMSKFEGAEDC